MLFLLYFMHISFLHKIYTFRFSGYIHFVFPDIPSCIFLHIPAFSCTFLHFPAPSCSFFSLYVRFTSVYKYSQKRTVYFGKNNRCFWKNIGRFRKNIGRFWKNIGRFWWVFWMKKNVPRKNIKIGTINLKKRIIKSF